MGGVPREFSDPGGDCRNGEGASGGVGDEAIGSGIWIEHVNMLADLRARYQIRSAGSGQTMTTETLVATWQDAETLVLDEFGVSRGGRDEEPLLYQVLTDRYDKRRPTIITSNLERGALRKAIGFRLMDRIGEDLTVFTMAWRSYRRTEG